MASPDWNNATPHAASVVYISIISLFNGSINDGDWRLERRVRRRRGKGRGGKLFT